MSGLSCLGGSHTSGVLSRLPRAGPQRKIPLQISQHCFPHPKEESKGICLQEEHLGFEVLPFHSLRQMSSTSGPLSLHPANQHLVCLSQTWVHCASCSTPCREETASLSKLILGQTSFYYRGEISGYRLHAILLILTLCGVS